MEPCIKESELFLYSVTQDKDLAFFLSLRRIDAFDLEQFVCRVKQA